MATTNFHIRDVKGLTPAVEARNSSEFFVVGGRNYVFDSLGPRSMYGNLFLLPQRVALPVGAQSVRLHLRTGDRVFHMFGDFLGEWQESLGGWRILWAYTDISDTQYRWSHGYLDGIMYFCHPAVGILAYDIDADRMIKMTLAEFPGLPEEPLALCVTNGRVVVITEEFAHWSNPGTGFDWSPGLAQAGFQKITDRVPGDPIMVMPYAKGFLTFTSGGIMRSEFTGDVETFRHRAITSEIRPMNSFCLVKIDPDTIVVLDERGFYQTRGEAPTLFVPLFNEFLIDYLQVNDLKLGQNVRLEWDDLQRHLYLSYSLSQANPLYEAAWVLYPSLDKWGRVEMDHYGVFPLLIQPPIREDDYFGFVGDDGVVRYWDDIGARELMPEDGSLNLFYPDIEKPPQTHTGTALVLANNFVMNTFPDSEISQRAAYYPPDGTTPKEATRTGLDAELQIGYVTANLEQANDELWEMLQISVRNGYSPIPEYELRVQGDVGGDAEFDSMWPELQSESGSVRYYSCSVVGRWHIIEFKAVEVEERFHIELIQGQLAYAGRLG